MYYILIFPGRLKLWSNENIVSWNDCWQQKAEVSNPMMIQSRCWSIKNKQQQPTKNRLHADTTSICVCLVLGSLQQGTQYLWRNKWGVLSRGGWYCWHNWHLWRWVSCPLICALAVLSLTPSQVHKAPSSTSSIADPYIVLQYLTNGSISTSNKYRRY